MQRYRGVAKAVVIRIGIPGELSGDIRVVSVDQAVAIVILIVTNFRCAGKDRVIPVVAIAIGAEAVVVAIRRSHQRRGIIGIGAAVAVIIAVLIVADPIVIQIAGATARDGNGQGGRRIEHGLLQVSRAPDIAAPRFLELEDQVGIAGSAYCLKRDGEKIKIAGGIGCPQSPGHIVNGAGSLRVIEAGALNNGSQRVRIGQGDTDHFQKSRFEIEIAFNDGHFRGAGLHLYEDVELVANGNRSALHQRSHQINLRQRAVVHDRNGKRRRWVEHRLLKVFRAADIAAPRFRQLKYQVSAAGSRYCFKSDRQDIEIARRVRRTQLAPDIVHRAGRRSIVKRRRQYGGRQRVRSRKRKVDHLQKISIEIQIVLYDRHFGKAGLHLDEHFKLLSYRDDIAALGKTRYDIDLSRRRTGCSPEAPQQ